MVPPPPSRRRRRLALRLTLTALLVVGVWTAGLFWFASTIPNRIDDPTTRTDAIVVLTGGSGRLDLGFELLAEDRAKKLFISGVFPGTDIRQLLQLFQRRPRYLEYRVDIGTATNTAGNAEETAAWMHEQGYSSLRLVTSGYHMPRSLLEFSYALPDVILIPHPVFSTNVKHERWWAWPGTLMLIVEEYTKFLAAWGRHLAAALMA